jgi:hypothetical protein
MIKVADADGDGQVTLAEFCMVMLMQPAPAGASR